MNNYANYWDKKLPENLKNSTYEFWLNNYINELKEATQPILDLGCGNGEDTQYLKNNNCNVVSSDFSIIAIQRVKEINTNTIFLDMGKSEDWKQLKDNSFSFVIANLSLHYFDSEITEMIMNEIKRILVPKGKLIARVNTTLDKEFGAGNGIEIEPNFYKNLERGINKRFFTEESVNKFFSIIGKTYINIKTIKYIGKDKQCYEIVSQKN